MYWNVTCGMLEVMWPAVFVCGALYMYWNVTCGMLEVVWPPVFLCGVVHVLRCGMLVLVV